MLYAAASLSLACLEILVHIRDTSNIPPLTFTEISIPDQLVMPWQKTDGRTTALLESEILSREFGDLCAQGDPRFCVYAVPSAIITQEMNYLIFPCPALEMLTAVLNGLVPAVYSGNDVRM